MARVKKIEKILVTRENIRRIMEDYDCSQSAVYNALRGGTNNEKASAIRRDAVQKYGGVLQKVPILVND